MALKRDTSQIGEALANAPLVMPRSLRAQIRELGGAKAAAQIAGRSVSSVYRWLRGINKPSASAKSALDQATSEWHASQDYRRSKLAPGREKRFRTKGARITIHGMSGPAIDSPAVTVKYRRIINYPLSADGMADILDAWLQGGDEAALERLKDVMAIDYLALQAPDVAEEGWDIETIDLIKFT
jgi:hypothetical protein